MSEQQDEASKTEEPTQKRIQDAENKGDFANSREINNAVIIAAMVIFVTWLAPWLMSDLKASMVFYLEMIDQIDTSIAGVHQLVARAIFDALRTAALPVLLALVFGVAASLWQTGGLRTTTEKIKPSLNKINPVSGFKRLLSPTQKLVEMVKSIAKVGMIGVVAYIVLQPVMNSVEVLTGIEMILLMRIAADRAFLLLVIIMIIMMLVAIADYTYQAYEYNKKLKMTKQEVKDEHKQSEGDPVVKARLRALRMEKARKRIMAAVPRADVVVTNPTHYAVALQYDASISAAPIVVAKGVDFIALQIRRVAEEHDVPIIENPPLARALHDTVEIDQEIPPDHYRAVAEIISYIYRLRGRAAAG